MDNFIQEKRLELKSLRAQYRQATKELYDFQANYTIGLISKLKEENLICITCNHEQTEIVSLGVEGLRKKEECHCANCHSDLIAITLAGQKFLMTQAEYKIVNDFKQIPEHKPIYSNWIPEAAPKTAKILKTRLALEKKYQKVQNEIIAKVVDGMKKTGMISSCEHAVGDKEKVKCAKCDKYLRIVSVGTSEVNPIYTEWDREETKFHEVIATIPEMYGEYGFNNIDLRFGSDE